MFYHSHMSFQKGDGLFGPYIVRRPAGTDPNDHLYDYDLTEHLIFPQEWFHKVLTNLGTKYIKYFFKTKTFGPIETISIRGSKQGLNCSKLNIRIM